MKLAVLGRLSSNEALLKTFDRSLEFSKSAVELLSGLKSTSTRPNKIF